MSPVLLLYFATAILVRTSTDQPQELRLRPGNSCSMPWFVWKSHSCKCGSSLDGIVTCQDDPVDVQIQPCYCMTSNKQTGDTVVGSCTYACAAKQHWYSNKTELNHCVCQTVWKRTGLLCSQCMEGYGPPVYSYSMQCIPCSPKAVRDSILLLLTSFLPLTVFCLTIITLRISVARPPLSTFVLVSQVMTSPQIMSHTFLPRQNISHASLHMSENWRNMYWKLFASFFGVWNLDMLRSFYPQMCLSPHMSTLQAKMMDYLVALFPIVILFMMYALVNLYYCCGYRIIFCVCRPIILCLARIRQTIFVGTSLIDAFATFIILSVIKTGYTSFVILQPVSIFTPDGNHTTRAYMNPAYTYFGADHLPYALTALVFSFVLIVIPLLLLFLYPLRSFQTFLNNRQWQCTTLHIFADSFQGCYKDGTNGTRDYRWFAGLHLLLRFILVVLFDSIHYHEPTIFLLAIITSFYMTALAVCQPYKNNLHFKLDIMLLFGLQLWSIYLLISIFGHSYVFHICVLTLATLIPFLYSVGLVLFWLIFRKRLHRRLMNRIMAVCCCNNQRFYMAINHSN